MVPLLLSALLATKLTATVPPTIIVAAPPTLRNPVGLWLVCTAGRANMPWFSIAHRLKSDDRDSGDTSIPSHNSFGAWHAVQQDVSGSLYYSAKDMPCVSNFWGGLGTARGDIGCRFKSDCTRDLLSFSSYVVAPIIATGFMDLRINGVAPPLRHARWSPNVAYRSSGVISSTSDGVPRCSSVPGPTCHAGGAAYKCNKCMPGDVCDCPNATKNCKGCTVCTDCIDTPASIEGLRVNTSTSLLFQSHTVVQEIQITNTASTSRDLNISLSVMPMPRFDGGALGFFFDLPTLLDARDFELTETAGSMVVRDKNSSAVGVFSLLGNACADLVPPSLRSVSSVGCWDSSNRHSGLSCGGQFLIHGPRLPSNSVRVLRIVFTAALNESEAQAEHARYLAQAKADVAISASEALWEQRWRASFSRDDNTYSGSLPVLSTSDAAIRRLYYSSLVSLMMLERSVPQWQGVAERVWVTVAGNEVRVNMDPAMPGILNGAGGGGIDAWDTSYVAMLLSLLDPANFKRYLKAQVATAPALVKDPAVPCIECPPAFHCLSAATGRACAPMPAGGWYVYNSQQFFDSIVTYLSVTGDQEFLHENCNGTQPLSLLKSLASNYQNWPHPLIDGQQIDLLADYGGNANYFDPNVVPSYNHVCASSQAGNVFMLEELATLLEQSDPRAAAAAKSTAIGIANLTLGLYEPSPGGAFACMNNTGARTQVRHVIDTVYVTWRMGEIIPRGMRAKMAQFARDELLTPNWMRALSTHDALHREPRPDWGTSGVYDAMPALLAESLAFLEADFGLPVEWLRNISVLAQEGPFGQAHAIPQTRDLSQSAFKPLQGFIMYNSVCSGTFAVALIRSVFGWRGVGKPLWQPSLARGGFVGAMRGLRTPEGSVTVIANDSGVYLG